MKSKIFLLTTVMAAQAASAEDIVVTGRGIGAGAGESAYDSLLIDRSRIDQSASGRLEDILRDAAGFQQFRRSDARSAHPTSQGATLRGLGGNASSRALVLLDGVPVADPFGGWIDWAALDPMRFDRITVTRGGGSGAAGPGALAGTIVIESIAPTSGTRVDAELAGGSRDSIDAGGILAAPVGDGHAMLGAHYQRSDGFVPIIRSQRGAADVPADYEQASIAGRMVFPVGDATELQANGLLFVDSRNRGLAFTDSRTRGGDASLRLVSRGSWRWEAAAWLQMRDFESQFGSASADRSTATQTLDQYSVPATGMGGRFEISPPLDQTVDLHFGADLRANRGSTHELFTYDAATARPTRIRNAGGRTQTAGAFADLAIKPDDALTLTGGARIDRWWIENGHLVEHMLGTGALIRDERPADRNGWETTARGGFAWTAMPTVSLRGAAYLGWRLPTLNELYRPFRAGADATAANPLLRPERLKGVDFGVAIAPNEAIRLSGTLFWNRLDNAIANVTIAQGPGVFPGVGFVSGSGFYRQRAIVDAFRARGGEFDARLALGHWSLAFGYAFVDSKVRADGMALALDGLRPAQTPKHHVTATLGYAEGERQAALTLRYVSAQYEDDQNARSLDGAVTLDASAAWPVAAGLSLVARAENLADARVETGISGAGIVERATPRTLWLGARYRLR